MRSTTHPTARTESIQSIRASAARKIQQKFRTPAALAAALFFAVFAHTTQANSSERGLEIALEADRRDTGWKDFRAGMKMVLRNRFGQESSRAMNVKGMEGRGDGDRTLTVFQSPGDVKGTAFLSFSHKKGPDDQWLYLPSVKRVKRIASNNKSGPFMGSEFAYEDITSQEVEKYAYKYLRDVAVNETLCYAVERVPVSPDSGYSRQVAYYDTEHYRPQKVEYFDRKNTLLKTLTYFEYRRYADKFWRAHRMEMVNHQTGKSTTLLWDAY
ncbi:MAG: outer membrane lipoprotein-sorting protein, partial [Leptospirales bacterium]